MSKKLPAFQFYPKDWLTDFNLSMCSLGAQGLWLRIMCYMHQGEPYGHLRVNGRVIGRDKLPGLVGKSPDEVLPLWDELVEWDVPAQDDDGCFYSRRMVDDEQKRQSFAAHGKRGGNPTIKGGKGKPGGLTPGLSHPDNGTDKAESLSSSSFASSSAMKEEVVVVVDAAALKTECLELVHRHFPTWGFAGDLWRQFLEYEDILSWELLLRAVRTTMAEGKTSLKYCLAICGRWAEAGWKTSEDVEAAEKRRAAVPAAKTGREPKQPTRTPASKTMAGVDPDEIYGHQ